MNVFDTFHNVRLIVIILLMPSIGICQLEQFEVLAEEEFMYEVYSNPNQPTASASNGYTSVNFEGNSQFSVSYNAYDGFIGLDTIEIGFWENPWTYKLKGLVVDVIPSRVEAVNDYATTGFEEDVLINVVSNDMASRGYDKLQLTGIPLVNNGLASPESNTTILFRPDPGFSGVTHLNYIVCDDIGTCATGTISVSVASNETPESYTVTYLTTSKNATLPIPLESDGFYIDEQPSKGSVALIGSNVIEYDPNQDYVGSDEFKMKKSTPEGNITRRFKIDILATQNPNGVIFDDYAYTPINTAVDIDVIENDLGNHNVVSYTQSSKGTVSKNDDGSLKFEPDMDFKGVAKFTYKIGAAGGGEKATVYVEVANQAPSSEVFDIYIPKNIPKPIYYNIPIDQFYFTIVDEADHGNIEYFPGVVDTEIYGYPITGNNILVYTPDIDFVGVDEFEIEYCVTSNNHCQLSKIRMHVEDTDNVNPNLVCTDLDCVWPGDGNNDGVVNMIDLLQLGMNIGEVGSFRPQASVEWFGQHAEDWGKTNLGSTVDAKYVDMNGNGMVSQDDIDPISMWYGRTHNLTPVYNPFAKVYPLYFEVASTQAIQDMDDPNDDFDYLITYDVMLGSDQTPAYNMYGLSFSLNYNTNYVVDGSMNIDFENDNWLAFNSPVIELTKDDETNGRFDIGYTRTSGYTISSPSSGNFKIAKLSFIVEDDLGGIRVNEDALKITVNNIYGLDTDGSMFELPSVSYELPMLSAPTSEELSEKDLTVFPNPSQNEINVYLSGLNTITEVAIYNTTGQEVYNSGQLQTVTSKINLEHLSDGMYILRAQTEKGMISRKVQIAHQ